MTGRVGDTVPGINLMEICWDKAPVERLFSSMKWDWTSDRLYRTRQEAIADVQEFATGITMPEVCTRRSIIKH